MSANQSNLSSAEIGYRAGPMTRACAILGLLLLATCTVPVRELTEGIDAGAADGGTADGGLRDAGARDSGFDLSACHLTPRAALSDLAKTPRADPFLELLILHGAPWLFVVDDETYARAAKDQALIDAVDAGRVGFFPSWGGGLDLQFDDAGAAQIEAGRYDAWACLNGLYRGMPTTHSGTLARNAFIEFAPVVSLPQLLPDYGALPHVTAAYAEGFGSCAACGCEIDTCLDLSRDGGTWVWIWYTETSTCARAYYRLRSEVDGGSLLETWPDAGLPRPWLDANPVCWDELWNHQRVRDAG